MGDYLIHYGVKGMKWGVRHDRPRVGRRRSFRQQPQQNNKRRSRLTDKQKKYLKIGAAVVATGLAVYGGYKLNQHFGLVGKAKDFRIFNEIKNSKTNTTWDEDLHIVDKKDSDVFIDKILDSPEDLTKKEARIFLNDIEDGKYENCSFCTATADMRRRGYDVVAGGSREGHLNGRFEYWYKNAVTYDINGEDVRQTYDDIKSTNEYYETRNETSYQKYKLGLEKSYLNDEVWTQRQAAGRAISVMLNMGDGASGDFSIDGDTSGHSMAFEVKGNKAYIFDFQSGKKFDAEEEFFKENGYFTDWDFNTAEMTRLDNAEPNIRGMLNDGVIKLRRK